MCCNSPLEAVADVRPEPPFAGVDRFFDEPDPAEDGRVRGLLGWSAAAGKDQRTALLRFTQWCACAPDGERRVILTLMSHYEGRLPKGAVTDIAEAAGVSRETVRVAVNRFTRYFPEGVSKRRRSLD
jgi:hypothetical protein